MNARDLYSLAARIWAELPGSYAERSETVVELIEALKDTRRAQRPPTTTRGTVDLATVINSVIGKPLSSVETVHVPLEGVMVNLPTIFRAAQEPGHPFAVASAKFLAENNLELQVTATGRRPTVRIGRRQINPDLARVQARFATLRMTDHSGGVTSTVPVERGDD
jgi:hypothetical protein